MSCRPLAEERKSGPPRVAAFPVPPLEVPVGA